MKNDPKKKRWFVASLLFEGVVESRPEERRVWEDRLILIEAASPEEADELAAELAVANEVEYTTNEGQVLRWVYRHCERVQEIDGPLLHGREIFSRFMRAAEVESLMKKFDDR